MTNIVGGRITKTSICMTGGPKRRKRVRLSRKTWMNSLIQHLLQRPNMASPLLQPLVECARSQQSQKERKYSHGESDRRTAWQWRSLQEYLLQQGDVIAGRHNTCESTATRRAFDRSKTETLKAEMRAETSQEARSGWRRLGLGNHGDKESQRKHNHHEQSGTNHQREIGSAKRHLEPVDGDSGADNHVEDAKDKNREPVYPA